MVTESPGTEPLKKITLTTLFYGTSFHQDHRTTTQAKDATSASKKKLPARKRKQKFASYAI